MEEAADITATLQSLGLVSSGDSLKGDLTLTIEESTVIQGAVQDFNSRISNVAGEFGVPVEDINEALMKLNNEGIDGYTSDFVLIDPVNTAYSLGGIHTNDGGYAIIANLFIETINESFGMALPLVNTEQFRGQYSN